MLWVCEAHPNLPWDTFQSSRACTCGAPGMPCPDCNPEGPDNPPKLPPGFKTDMDDEGGPRH
jgi:hypothetical protein